MSQLINSCLMWLNNIGQGFCTYAASIFVQSSVLIVLLLIIDFMLRKRVKATFRYWIWMLVFVKLVLPPSLSLPTGIGYWFRDIMPAKQTISEPIQNITVAESIFEPVAHGTSDLSTKPLSLDESRATSHDSLIMYNEPVSTLPEITWQAVVFVLWLVGVLVISVLLIQRMWFVRRLIARSESAANRLAEILNQCVRQVGIGRKIELRLSHNVSSPAVCGLFKPVILIPETLLGKLSQDRLKAVLIHELAHIKRGDLWVNLAQTILQVIYFYNPLVWLVNVLVRRVREQAVDEMVLVALGAEAKSYSNTLIDIAEMAFFRTSLSLRLIGVAESKKSLEGRIKHMLVRPIPKSAKIGVVGLLIIIIAGAVLLPMAATAKDNEKKEPRFIAMLPEGVTVELVGVCEHPSEGKKWWQPDGSFMSNIPYETTGGGVDVSQQGYAEYEFTARVAGSSDYDMTWIVLNATKSTYTGHPLDENGERVSDLEAYIANQPGDKDSTTVRIGIASGPWDMAMSIKTLNEATMSIDDIEVGFGTPYEKDGYSYIPVTYIKSDFENKAVRLFAVDKNGKERPTGCTGSGGNKLSIKTYTLSLKLEDIDHFTFKARPYQWVNFKNVSLQPGVKTDVKVQAGSDEKKDYSSFVVEEGVGFGDIIVGDFNCTGEFIKSKLGQPDKETKDEKTGWWLSYGKTYGLDFWINLKENVLLEIRLNEGFKGKLTSGISLASTKEDVFNTYGRPVEEKTVSDLTKHFDNQVLYQRKRLLGIGKPQNSKIFYTHHGLLFWFEGNKILQIVIHRKEVQLMEKAHDVSFGLVDDAQTKAVRTYDAERAKSTENLKQLALALIMYANDHSGNPAADLNELKPYLGKKALFEWILENVEYVGQDKMRKSDARDHRRPVAYDKTLLRKGTGTNVAFVDGHVEFMPPRRLEELSITFAEKTDVQVDVVEPLPIAKKRNASTEGSAPLFEVVNNQARMELLEKTKDVTDAMIQAFNGRDISTLLSYYTEDGIELPDQYEAAIGKGALHKLQLQEKDKNVKIHSVNEIDRKVWICGDFVFEAGKIVLSFSSPTLRFLLSDWRNYVTVWTRQPDGSLKIKLGSTSPALIPEGANIPDTEPADVKVVSSPGLSDDNMEAVYEQIREHESTFHKKFVEQDAKGATQFYADDAILMPWGHDVVRGKSDILKYIKKEMNESPLVDMTQHVVHIEGNNQMLFAVNLFSWTFKDTSSGENVTFPGKGVHVWMRQQDGSWKILLDLYNVSVPITDK